MREAECHFCGTKIRPLLSPWNTCYRCLDSEEDWRRIQEQNKGKTLEVSVSDMARNDPSDLVSQGDAP